jgi:hypothetical protein
MAGSRSALPYQCPLVVLRNGVDVREEFRQRIRSQLLPTYLEDYGRTPGAYVDREERITSLDAAWFLRSIDEGIVAVESKARLKLPASRVKAMIFWSGSGGATSIHLEGILSAGAAARLHIEYGWPVESLGFEFPDERGPGRRAFDLGAVGPSKRLVLAGEAKKSKAELDRVIDVMQQCSSLDKHEHAKGHKDQNGHRKMIGLVRCRPSIFWTFGPADDWSVFDVAYVGERRVELRPTGRDRLQHPSA